MRLLLTTALLSAAFLPAAQVPRPATPLKFTTPNGQTINVADYKGKVVVLEILSTTCPSCQKSARMLSQIKNQYGPKGVEMLGMAINPDANVPEFIRNFGVNYPVGRGSRDDAYAFLQISVMSPFYFPQLVFIDQTGTIRGQYGGTDPFLSNNEEANIRGMLDKLLAEGSAGAKKPAPSAKPRKRTS